MKKIVYKAITLAMFLLASGFFLKSAGLAKLLGEEDKNGKAIHLTCRASDGLMLHAWLGDVSRPDAADSVKPGLALLLPSLSQTHSAFDPFMARLHQTGYGTLAFDLRGHGLSIDAGSVRYEDMDSAAFARIPDDVEQFFRWFKASHPDEFNYGRVVIIGSSIGANVAGMLIERDWPAKVVLLSPGRDYRGLMPERVMAFPGSAFITPICIAAAADDTYAAESGQWLFDNYKGPKVLKKYPGQDHGSDILYNVKNADNELLEWLKK